MTLKLTVLDDDGRSHTYLGCVGLAVREHFTPDRTQQLLAGIAAAGGEHDPTTCERCKAHEQAKSRVNATQGTARAQLIALALANGAPVKEGGYVPTIRAEHDDALGGSIEEYVAGWCLDESDVYLRPDEDGVQRTERNMLQRQQLKDWHRQTQVKSHGRRMRGLIARVNACPPNKRAIVALCAELRGEVKRCTELLEQQLPTGRYKRNMMQPMLPPETWEQVKAMRALYRFAYDMAMAKYTQLMFGKLPPPPKRKMVRSTPKALGMEATYEAVCSCGHGYVH